MRREYCHLVILLVLGVLVYIPFVYQNTTGEYDSMRMVMGIIGSLNSDRLLTGYNYSISFAYYQALEIFRPLFVQDHMLVITIMNYFNGLIAVLFVIPFYIVIRRYWGIRTAVAANILLFFQPIWWNLSLYGHPMLHSIFFLFIGLSLLGIRERCIEQMDSRLKCSSLVLFAIAAFSLALMFRLDAVLMFPLITSVLWMERKRFPIAMINSLLYGIVALLIYFVFNQLTLHTGVSESAGLTSIFDRLLYWHSFDKLTENLYKGMISIVFGGNVVYLLGFAIATLYLANARQYKNLFFLLPVVLLNLLFWLPNPLPTRHFAYITPLLALGLGMLIKKIPLTENWQDNKKKIIIIFMFPFMLVILSMFISELVYPIAKNNYPWKYKPQEFSWRIPLRSVILNKEKAEDYFSNARLLGRSLNKLEKKDRKIMVIGDPVPIITDMYVFSEGREITYKIPLEYCGVRFYEVNNGINKFILPLNLVTVHNNLENVLNKIENYNNYYLVVDKANSQISFNPIMVNKNYKIIDM